MSSIQLTNVLHAESILLRFLWLLQNPKNYLQEKDIFTRMLKDTVRQMVTMLDLNPQPPEDEANVIPLADKMDHFDILYKTFAP